jgi:uncharacterized membrane protein
MILVIIILFYFLTPFLILHLCHKFPFVNKLGAIVIAYLAGIVLGVFKIIPEQYRDVQEMIMNITVPVALPLMLFSSNIKEWAKIAGKTLVSMILAVAAMLIFIISGYLIFKSKGSPDLWQIGGLLVGLYTGGTPNLASLKIMLNVKNEAYLITNTYDMLLSTVYFLFLISAGKGLFAKILPPFRLGNINNVDNGLIEQAKQEPYWGLFKKKNGLPLLKGFLLSFGIFLIGGLSTLFVSENSKMIVIMLVITTLGISASIVPSINKLPKTFELGMYFILVFSIDVASLVDVTEMMGAEPKLFYYITFVIFGALTFHVLISSLFKIDRDTVMVTSTALICSPPFVPAVAGAVKNKEVVAPGLTVGIIGYAIGNYLGLVMAEFLKTL